MYYFETYISITLCRKVISHSILKIIIMIVSGVDVHPLIRMMFRIFYFQNTHDFCLSIRGGYEGGGESNNLPPRHCRYFHPPPTLPFMINHCRIGNYPLPPKLPKIRTQIRYPHPPLSICDIRSAYFSNNFSFSIITNTFGKFNK